MQNLISLKKTGIALAVTQALAINISSAATVTVNNAGDGPMGCSFREAVQSINRQNTPPGCTLNTTDDPIGTNDTVLFDSLITEVSLEDQVSINRDMSINPGGHAVIVSGNNNTRILEINDADVVIENMTVTNGSTNSDQVNGGGGIYVKSSTVTLNNSTITENSAATYDGPNGGGIFSQDSILTLNNSTISKNSSFSDGGGIFVRSSTVTLNNSTISENSATSTGEGSGGGIFSGFSITTIINSTISENYSSRRAGGIYSVNGTLTLNSSTIFGNYAASNLTSGGGIRTNNILNISNSIISGNSTALNSGNEISLSSSNTPVNTDINNLFGNSSQTSAEAFYQFPPSSTNIIATSDGNTPTPLVNILAPLAGNGGPTQTHALVIDSPAIDAVDNTLCAAAPINNLDQRGESRPVGNACDIGSFEGLAPTEPDTTFFVVPLPNGSTVIFGL